MSPTLVDAFTVEAPHWAVRRLADPKVRWWRGDSSWPRHRFITIRHAVVALIIGAGHWDAASEHVGGRACPLIEWLDMFCTCFYLSYMPAMIRIRNVPDALHRRLKSRAALAGMSLSDYLLSEIRQVAERPTIEELRARLERRTPIAPSIAPTEAIRAARERE